MKAPGTAKGPQTAGWALALGIAASCFSPAEVRICRRAPARGAYATNATEK